MDILAHQHEPGSFARIREAFQTARELPEWRPTTIRVGVCRSDGELLAVGMLHDQRQARLFAIQMGGLGYGEAGPRGGCDQVFVPVAWEAGAATPSRAAVAS